jgi:predicted O-methyltransferase YrrM
MDDRLLRPTDVAQSLMRARIDGRLGAMMMSWLAQPLLHRFGTAPLNNFAEELGSDHIYSDAREAMQSLLSQEGTVLSAIFEEYESVWESLKRDSAASSKAYPLGFDLARAGGEFLYAWCRMIRPDLVVETGVANGLSSSIILRALSENQNGHLVSIDVRDDVGALARLTNQDRWELVVLQGRSLRMEFKRVMSNLPRGDLFLHDSNHTYDWQRFEMEVASSWLSSDGLLVVDDADASYAFLDHCRANGSDGSALFLKNRLLGWIGSGQTLH